MKVYCSKCRWYKCSSSIEYFYEACNYVDNILDTYAYKGATRKRKPRLINRNNNCEWFEKKISIWKRIKSGITNRKEI